MLCAAADLAALYYHRQAIHIQPSAKVLCNNLVSHVCRYLKPVSDNNGNEMDFFVLLFALKVLDTAINGLHFRLKTENGCRVSVRAC